MRYAVLVGISVHGELTDKDEAMEFAREMSMTAPLRLVRVIDTHDDIILFEIRNGEAQA